MTNTKNRTSLGRQFVIISIVATVTATVVVITQKLIGGEVSGAVTGGIVGGIVAAITQGYLGHGSEPADVAEEESPDGDTPT